MLSLVVVGLLLLVLPYRLSRGFPGYARVAIVLIVVVKSILLVAFHFSLVKSTGFPVILDQSVDAKMYYDFGGAFEGVTLRSITFDDLVAERGAASHLGYYVVNLLAFKICPQQPILFLRLVKLLLFHIGLGMLATTWRLHTSARRAFAAYVVLGLVFYQFFYYNFRNLKDDVVLALFMMVMAIVDRQLIHGAWPRTKRRTLGVMVGWVAVVGLMWALSTLRFYLVLAMIAAFAMHVVTGRGLRIGYRVAFASLIAVGFLFLTTRAGYGLVQSQGGASVLTGAARNVYGLFKVFVSPLPWQHGQILLSLPHTLYLFMLAPALWAFLARLRSNLDWKVYVVLLVALAVGGYMQDFEPRKRYVMYPIFMSWIVMNRRREAEPQAETEGEPFDPDAYFARPHHVYAG